MDIKDRVMGDQPRDFLHKIAGMVPGYNGYVDREKRRDADKILRTQLARKYTAQRSRLTRVQQQLLRSGDLRNISEIDNLAGVLQRFIDRLENATYGYAGLFDPIKVEAQDLDQLYAFDMALVTGVDTLSGAIASLESAAGVETAKAEMPAATDRLATVINDLNERFDQRADLLTSGNRLQSNEYSSLLNSLQQPTGAQPPPGTATPPLPGVNPAPVPTDVPAYQGATPGGAGATTGSGSAGSPTVNMSSMGADTPDKARVEGTMDNSHAAGGPKDQAGIAGSGASTQDAVSPASGGPIVSAADGEHSGALLPVDEPSFASGGEPTTRMAQMEQMPQGPDVNSMADGNQGFEGTPMGEPEGGSAPMPQGGSADSGIETASSPAAAPGAPGGHIVDSMSLANSMNNLGGTQVTGTGSSDITTLNPGTGSDTGVGKTGSTGSETQS